MKIKVYGYKNCSTCKKAMGFLGKKKCTVDEIDITEQAPTKSELKAMLAHYGGELKKLFNTSGQVYREMKISDKLKGMSEADALTLLASNGRLVKRPFLIVDGEAAAVGFNESEWLEAL